MSLSDFFDEKLGKTPKKEGDITPKVRTIVKKIDVSPEIKKLFYRLNGEADKVWGLDNNYKNRKEKPHDIPKYRNIWDYWIIFKEWFEREVIGSE